MNIYKVVEHFQKILNNCGDPVILSTTGKYILDENAQYSIDLEEAFVLKKNNCFELPKPQPSFSTDSEEKYKINRIRVGIDSVDDYSKGYTYRDDEILGIIQKKKNLFAFYEKTN